MTLAFFLAAAFPFVVALSIPFYLVWAAKRDFQKDMEFTLLYGGNICKTFRPEEGREAEIAFNDAAKKYPFNAVLLMQGGMLRRSTVFDGITSCPPPVVFNRR